MIFYYKQVDVILQMSLLFDNMSCVWSQEMFSERKSQERTHFEFYRLEKEIWQQLGGLVSIRTQYKA